MVYREEVYDAILNYEFGVMHYDRALSNITKVYVINQLFASEHPGYSDHLKKEVDHSHHLARYAKLG
jgi:hypothetical protein